jgi:Lon protease-like protein
VNERDVQVEAIDKELEEAHLEELCIFPLPDIVLFPYTVLPLHVFEPRYRELVRDARREGLPVAMTRIVGEARESAQGEAPRVHSVAGVGTLHSMAELPDGRFLIELLGRARVRILEELPLEKPYRRVRAVRLPEQEPSSKAGPQLEILRGILLGLRDAKAPASHVLGLLSRGAPSHVVADVTAHLFVSDAEERQALLEELDPDVRLRRVTACLAQLMLPERQSDQGHTLN